MSCSTDNIQGQHAFPPSLPWAGMRPSLLLRFRRAWVQIMLTVKALPFRYRQTWLLFLFKCQQYHYTIPLLINDVTILMSSGKYICLQTLKSYHVVHMFIDQSCATPSGMKHLISRHIYFECGIHKGPRINLQTRSLK